MFELAGPFFKRVCIFGTPVPGVRPGSTRTPRICDTEPTILLAVLVAGAIVGVIVAVVLYVTGRRRDSLLSPATPPVMVVEGAAQQRDVQPRAPVGEERDRADEWRRDVYVRLMAFVDKAMAEVGRTMPEDDSVPDGPPIAPEPEESGRLAAELRALASSRARSAYAAWAQTLFHFSLLARDVAEAESHSVPKDEYRDDVIELQRTRTTVFELADGLRRQAAEELMKSPPSMRP